MTPRQKLQARDKGILERKFIHQVLNQEGQAYVDSHKEEIRRLLTGETGALLSAPKHNVNDSGQAGGTVTVTHLKRQRFLDMKTRKLKSGRTIRKKAYNIHNKIVYGRLNNIIRQLAYGFTNEVRNKIKRELTIPAHG